MGDDGEEPVGLMEFSDQILGDVLLFCDVSSAVSLMSASKELHSLWCEDVGFSWLSEALGSSGFFPFNPKHVSAVIQDAELVEAVCAEGDPRGGGGRGKTKKMMQLLSDLAAFGQTEEVTEGFSVLTACVNELASSTDHIQQKASQTLTSGYLFWSSTGNLEPQKNEEALVFKLDGPDCVVTSASVWFYKATHFPGAPVFAPLALKVEVGPEPDLYSWESEWMDVRFSDGRQDFPIAPLLAVGGFMKLRFRGSRSLQYTDCRFYTCVRQVRAYGIPLSEDKLKAREKGEYRERDKKSSSSSTSSSSSSTSRAKRELQTRRLESLRTTVRKVAAARREKAEIAFASRRSLQQSQQAAAVQGDGEGGQTQAEPRVRVVGGGEGWRDFALRSRAVGLLSASRAWLRLSEASVLRCESLCALTTGVCLQEGKGRREWGPLALWRVGEGAGTLLVGTPGQTFKGRGGVVSSQLVYVCPPLFFLTEREAADTVGEVVRLWEGRDVRGFKAPADDVQKSLQGPQARAARAIRWLGIKRYEETVEEAKTHEAPVASSSSSQSESEDGEKKKEGALLGPLRYEPSKIEDEFLWHAQAARVAFRQAFHARLEASVCDAAPSVEGPEFDEQALFGGVPGEGPVVAEVNGMIILRGLGVFQPRNAPPAAAAEGGNRRQARGTRAGDRRANFERIAAQARQEREERERLAASGGGRQTAAQQADAEGEVGVVETEEATTATQGGGQAAAPADLPEETAGAQAAAAAAASAAPAGGGDGGAAAPREEVRELPAEETGTPYSCRAFVWEGSVRWNQEAARLIEASRVFEGWEPADTVWGDVSPGADGCGVLRDRLMSASSSMGGRKENTSSAAAGSSSAPNAVEEKEEDNEEEKEGEIWIPPEPLALMLLREGAREARKQEEAMRSASERRLPPHHLEAPRLSPSDVILAIRYLASPGSPFRKSPQLGHQMRQIFSLHKFNFAVASELMACRGVNEQIDQLLAACALSTFREAHPTYVDKAAVCMFLAGTVPDLAHILTSYPKEDQLHFFEAASEWINSLQPESRRGKFTRALQNLKQMCTSRGGDSLDAGDIEAAISHGAPRPDFKKAAVDRGDTQWSDMRKLASLAPLESLYPLFKFEFRHVTLDQTC